MDKNTLTGLFLIALVLIGYSYFAKQEAQSQGTEQIQAKQRTPSTDTKPQQAIQPQKVDSSDVFYTALADSQAARPVVLRNENVAVTLSPKGGVVSEVHLLNFKSYKDFHEQSNKNLTLFDAKTAQMEFQLETTKGLYNLQIRLQHLHLELQQETPSILITHYSPIPTWSMLHSVQRDICLQTNLFKLHGTTKCASKKKGSTLRICTPP